MGLSFTPKAGRAARTSAEPRNAAPPEQSRCELHSRGSFVIAEVAGEWDLSNAPRLREQLAGTVARRDGLVVDLTRADFIDCATLNALLAIRRRCRTLPIVCPRPHLMRVFELTGLDRVFPLVAELDEALQLAGRSLVEDYRPPAHGMPGAV